MIDLDRVSELRGQLEDASRADLERLVLLRQEAKRLGQSRTIARHSTTSVSFVASDGGNNRLKFDPFEIQLIRVVDSFGSEACFEIASRGIRVEELDLKHISINGQPLSPLGEMMLDLGVLSLTKLSPMLKPKRDGSGNFFLPSSWSLVYRDLIEWSIIYRYIKSGVTADTLLLVDGLLRSKVFSDDLFIKLIRMIQEYIVENKRKTKREIYLVGLAKHSKVLERYRLAMTLEGIMREARAVYTHVPNELEELSYDWPEYTRRPGEEKEGEEKAKFVGGRLYLAKFGSRPGDPIWPIDILLGQEGNADKIMAYILADAVEGFPIPYYPQCLQKAHAHAAIAGLDSEILQQEIIRSLMNNLNSKEDIESFEEFILAPDDSAGRRYD